MKPRSVVYEVEGKSDETRDEIVRRVRHEAERAGMSGVEVRVNVIIPTKKKGKR